MAHVENAVTQMLENVFSQDITIDINYTRHNEILQNNFRKYDIVERK